ncbi:hypothetical protein IFM89_023207 [Coptis chinensis]|uniref:BTB domain-containing protein n=1 Tax=Coptis chinensis TaxID=261450 RepID=A0A835I6G1_9MAGN|nr:hypothetical protein IFM89_023207 [Coptis chinensis]
MEGTYEEHVLNCGQPGNTDSLACEKHGEEAVEAIDSSKSMVCSEGSRVRTLHVSSPILAAKSQYFHKLFSNGMKESEERLVTLRINASEEAAVFALIFFIYSNTLSVTCATSLLDLLVTADKYEVPSCMRYCCKLLQNLPMTLDIALDYLNLPSAVLCVEIVQQLTKRAREHLLGWYKDFTNNVIKVPSEDYVFEFLLKWSRTRYPKLEDQREVLDSCLHHLIRFQYMTCRKLSELLNLNDLSQSVARGYAFHALMFKAETPHRQRLLSVEDPVARFVQRNYIYRPVKVVEFELPKPQTVVYFELRREDCCSMFPAERVFSEGSYLGEHTFYLAARCSHDEQPNGVRGSFGLSLLMRKGSECLLEFEFAGKVLANTRICG